MGLWNTVPSENYDSSENLCEKPVSKEGNEFDMQYKNQSSLHCNFDKRHHNYLLVLDL